MKFFISLVLIALLSMVACFYLPWWIIAVVAFAVAAMIPQKAGWSFLCGFTALFILWGVLAWYLSSNNNHILAHRMSLVILKKDSPFSLILLTAFIGAIVAGFAALAGSYVRKRPKSSYADRQIS